jgi:predicted nucleic acid-binding protein
MFVVDANVWVSYYLLNDVNYAPSKTWLDQQIANSQLLVAPTLLLPEVSGAIARRTGLTNEGLQAIARITNFTTLNLINVTDSLGKRAADLAADLRLRGADAIYVAVAHQIGVPLVTWDNEILTRANRLVQVLTP